MDNEKLIRLCNELPDCCDSFFFETANQMTITTKIAYARELSWFFDYLISYCPEFCDLEKKKITMDDIKKITSQDISRYLTIYLNKGEKERTVARKRAALSSFFTYLTHNQKIAFNPVLASTKIKIHTSDEVLHLNIDEQNVFLNAINNGTGLDNNKLKYHDKYRTRDLALTTLLLDTGMRVSELHGINIVDIDFDKCSVIVTRKGGNNQTLYFSDSTCELLKDYLEERKALCPTISIMDPFFVTLKGNRLSVRAIEVLVKKYSTAAIPGKGDKMSVHKLRSSFAMEFYDSSHDILALQRKLGHKNLSATNIYAKATDKKMQETRSILEEKRQRKENN